MHPIGWLEAVSPGFARLGQPERDAPMHFSLLWSYFEAVALRTNASANAIDAWIRELHADGRIQIDQFDDAIAYIRNRYYRGGFTSHFENLHLRNNDQPDFVKAVISGQDNTPIHGVIALFIVIYRFRNNYFHGPKWADHLRGQHQNFTVANESIMAVIEMARMRR